MIDAKQFNAFHLTLNSSYISKINTNILILKDIQC